MNRKILTLLVIATLPLLILACTKPAEPPPAPAPAPAPAPEPTPPPAPAPALTVTAVDLGSQITPEKKVAAPMTVFAPKDTIYASVATDGTGTGIAIKALWTFGDGQKVSEETQMVDPTGPAVTEFHIAKPDGWPVGKYKVEIFVNDLAGGSKDFEVK